MKIRPLAIAAALFLSLFVGGAANAQAPSGAVYPTEPFASGAYFATSKCIAEKFPCSPSLSREQMTSVANSCASETFGVEGIMGELGKAKNGYQGCVLPTNFVEDSKASLKKKWTICCIAPAKVGNMCTMDCHLYYNNK